jgi:type II secretory pathway pseudopilin PulG
LTRIKKAERPTSNVQRPTSNPFEPTGERWTLAVRNGPSLDAESQRLLCRPGGFTLIEALVATTVTVLAGSAILLALESSLRSTEMAREQSIGQGIAQQLLDEVACAKYPPAGSAPQPPALGAGSSRAAFDDIDDYHGYSSVPADRWGRPLGTGGVGGTQRHPLLRLRDGYFSHWQTTIEVYFVSDSNLSQPLTGGQTSNHRAVRVRVVVNDPVGASRQVAEAQRVFANVPQP